ncbi:MAG: serine hydrolase, partial [Micropepsaceae bacterium]
MLAAALLFHSGARAQSSQKSSLTRLVEAEVGRFVGPGGPYRGGIYIKHLGTGEEASVNATRHFETASTFKLAVMVLAYQMADQKKLNLNERYTIKPSDIRGGSGIFRYQDMGLNPTIRDVITQMIITSDNSATDIMLAKVGGVGALNAWLKQSGYNDFHVNSTIFEYFRQRYDVLDAKYAKMSPEELYALGTNNPVFTTSRNAFIKEVEEGMTRSAARVNEEMAKRRGDEKYWLG